MATLSDSHVSALLPEVEVEKNLLLFWPKRLHGPWSKIVSHATFAFLNGAVATAVLALLAHVTGSPLVFPSLGPTAFLLFHHPLADPACPRNTFLGHLIGIGMGWLSLAALGLIDAPPILDVGVSWPRIAAAALSVGLTSGLMILLRVPHPPAGATTLIVSLGLIHEPWQYPLLIAGVGLLIVQGALLNRLAGLPYPLWRPVARDIKAHYPSFS